MAVEIEKNDNIWMIVLHPSEVWNAVDHSTSYSHKLLWSNGTSVAVKSSPNRRIMKLAFSIFIILNSNKFKFV